VGRSGASYATVEVSRSHPTPARATAATMSPVNLRNFMRMPPSTCRRSQISCHDRSDWHGAIKQSEGTPSTTSGRRNRAPACSVCTFSVKKLHRHQRIRTRVIPEPNRERATALPLRPATCPGDSSRGALRPLGHHLQRRRGCPRFGSQL
jgi:hypothetical protein